MRPVHLLYRACGGTQKGTINNRPNSLFINITFYIDIFIDPAGNHT
ncbi:hypothetical protein SXCC_02261 [Gluconacetobacter sp. SXCC-1]|nr:hypothetical protein SXCC_02261 [Gluconacetobacter sp. SXCC-1]